MKIMISENIRNLRKEKNMMQEHLAEALGVSIGAVSKWERGATLPDLENIMEMADLFEVSVDALLGYEVQSGNVTALVERIRALQRSKDYAQAVIEAEKALTRYPNDFLVVYRCGELYQLKGIEEQDIAAMERGVELLERAICLLSQNTDPEISEVSIRTAIAEGYLSLGKADKGVDILKQNNICGIHNSLIGYIYSCNEEHKPEEASEYLMGAFSDCFQKQFRTMCGYANVYARMNDWKTSLETIQWLAGYLESLRSDDKEASYIDKICAPLYVECGRMMWKMEQRERAEEYLSRAYTYAQKFDAAPSYGVKGIKFCIGDVSKATAYDDLGETAMKAVEKTLYEGENVPEFLELWESMVQKRIA